MNKSLLPMIVSVVLFGVVVFAGWLALNTFSTLEYAYPERDLEHLVRRTDELRRTLQEANERLRDTIWARRERLQESDSVAPPTEEARSPPEWRAELRVLRDRTDSIGSSLAALEGFIVRDPVQVLSVPMLRRDLDALRREQDLRFRTLQRDLDRTIKIGLGALSLLIGLLAIGIGLLARRL